MKELKPEGASDNDKIFGFTKTNTFVKWLSRTINRDDIHPAKDFQSHNLRHSKVTHMLEDKEFDPTEVSKYARHARMDTTMGYYHPNKKAIYDKLAKG